MFRRKLSRWSKHEDDDNKTPCSFTEPFWQYYVDSLTRQQGHESSSSSPINNRKYTPNSSAVVQLKALFGSELPQPSTFQAISALKSPFSGGDVSKAYHFIRYFQISECGFFITNNGVERNGAEIQLMGAENWENVLCYFDSLIFSMFANLDSFEPILFILNQHSNPLVSRLLGLLRVYVNLLRLGNLITTDITQRICECLMQLGFEEAMSHRQQDSAPLFEFLTETLAMPLLTFRVEIQHRGKHEEDDTKYSKERILFVSVPDEGEGEPVKPAQEHVEMIELEDNSILLEECLEHYFNNSISVKRALERRATFDSQRMTEENPAGLNALISVTRPRATSNLTYTRPEIADSQNEEKDPHPRKRASTLSIWSASTSESKPREVMLPAWMLLRLLPFYTDDNSEGIVRNSKEFANRRPVVPICLKRYSFSAADQQASRSKKKIVIPPVIDLPLFVADDEQSGQLMGGFKLILESAVCHRGTSIASGHFVSAIRKNSPNDNEPTLESPWYLYDDMKTHKVKTKTFQEIFDNEWPYMLFYRLVSTDDMEPPPSKTQRMKSFSNVNPMSVPNGSKSKYWAEEPLSRIVSASSFGENDAKASLHSEVVKTLSSSASSEAHSSSIPIPDFLPGNPNFVDIRSRYLWYVTDKEKNYYRESASLSKSGSRNVSISFTPQFRRNSQWSEISNISGLSLQENGDSQNADLEKVKQILDDSKQAKEHASEYVIGEDISSHIISDEHKNLSSGENHSHSEPNTPHSEPKTLHSHHMHRIFSHDKDPPVSSSKHHRKQRADYKKEKCVIV